MATNLINGLGGTTGFGENFLFRNDDESTSLIEISSIFESGLNFFGNNYTDLYINNNGNITFTSSLYNFIPFGITESLIPIIAAFFADVDTRSGELTPSPGGVSTGSNLLYWDFDTANDRMIITWDDVGAYDYLTVPNAFQMVLTDLGNGDFSIEFRYEEVEWLLGDASDNEVARAGYSSGNGVDYFELPQSGTEEMANLENTSNIGDPGRYLFNVINGRPTEYPVFSEPFNFTISESNQIGSQVGTINVTDPDGQITKLEIINGNNDLNNDGIPTFGINNQGLIIVTDSNDLKAQAGQQGQLTIEATDNDGFSNTAIITIEIRESLIFDLPGSAEDIEIQGNVAAIATYGTGLFLVDISQPDSPAILGQYDTDGQASKVAFSGNLALVADGSKGLQVIDISDQTKPILLANYPTDAWTYSVAVRGNNAFLADGRNGLQIIDLNNPSTPQLVANFDTEGAVDVDLLGDQAIVADGFGGLKIINIADLTKPNLISQVSTDGYTENVEILDNKAYIADWSKGLEIIDLNNPSQPVAIASYGIEGQARNLTVVDNKAFVIDKDKLINEVDITNPNNPQLLSSYEIKGSARDLNVIDNQVYVASGYVGLEQFNLDPLVNEDNLMVTTLATPASFLSNPSEESISLDPLVNEDNLMVTTLATPASFLSNPSEESISPIEPFSYITECLGAKLGDDNFDSLIDFDHNGLITPTDVIYAINSSALHDSEMKL